MHDESRQRRAKEREDNRSERFSSLSLESYPSFDRSRFASAHKCAGAYIHVITSWFPRHRATPGGVFAVRARGAYVFYCIKVIPAALTLQFKYPNVAGISLRNDNVSASGANRGFATGRCPASRRLPNAFTNVRHRTLAVRRRSAIRRKEKGFPKGKGKQPERVSLFPLVRLCLLSPHSESKCLPGMRAS